MEHPRRIACVQSERKLAAAQDQHVDAIIPPEIRHASHVRLISSRKIPLTRSVEAVPPAGQRPSVPHRLNRESERIPYD
jgi:hypothetical protein